GPTLRRRRFARSACASFTSRAEGTALASFSRLPMASSVALEGVQAEHPMNSRNSRGRPHLCNSARQVRLVAVVSPKLGVGLHGLANTALDRLQRQRRERRQVVLELELRNARQQARKPSRENGPGPTGRSHRLHLPKLAFGVHEFHFIQLLSFKVRGPHLVIPRRSGKPQ